MRKTAERRVRLTEQRVRSAEDARLLVWSVWGSLGARVGVSLRVRDVSPSGCRLEFASDRGARATRS